MNKSYLMRTSIHNDELALWEILDDHCVLVFSDGIDKGYWTPIIHFCDIGSWEFDPRNKWDILTEDEYFLEVL